MQSIAEFVFECLGGMALVIGMVLLFANGKQMAQTYLQVKEVLLEHEVVYEEEQVTKTSDEVPKEEVMAMLMTELSYPISLDGMIRTKENHNPRFFPYSSLGSFYKKQSVYDNEGNIKQITYTRK